MKNKLFCTVLILIVIASGLVNSYADIGSETNLGSGIVSLTKSETSTESKANEQKEPIKLSLKAALIKMETIGVRAETAELNKKSDIAVANGYSEKASMIKKTLDGLDKLESLPDQILSYLGYTRSKVMDLSYEAQVAGATQIA